MKRNTLPLTQANFDVLMEAFHTLAGRVSQSEHEITILKRWRENQEAINNTKQPRMYGDGE